MFLLLVTHLFDNRATPRVAVRQSLEMAVEVVANLLLGFPNETEAPLVTENPACRSNRKRTGIPQWRQPADVLAEFADALLAPRQVVEFLVRRMPHLFFDRPVASDRRVPVVQRLGRNLAGVIDAHQAGRMGFLALVEIRVDDVLGGIGSRRPSGRRGNGSQGVVGAGEETVQRRQLTSLHHGIIAKRPGPQVYSAAFRTTLTNSCRSRRMNLRTLVTIAALAAPFAALAQDAQEPESPWGGKATLGYLATSGNTENSTLNTGFEVGYTADKWAHLFRAAAVNASENEVNTAEAYDVGWKSERRLTDQDFLFGRLDWRKDRFGGFDNQFAQTVGYGRRLIDTDKHKLNAEIGVGARQSEAQDGTEDRETIGTGGLYYRWLFSDTAEFRQDLSVESGSENTFAQSVTAIKARLIGDLALVASYTVKHNTDVPPLTEETDTYTALSLEYGF